MKQNKTFKIICICVIAAFVLAIAGVLILQSGVLSAKPEVKAKADNCYDETLYVITDEDYMPYSFYEEDGTASGHDVELIILIANTLHMNLDMELLPWNDGIDAIVNGKTDILMTCDYSDTFNGVDSLLKTEPVSTDEFIVYSKTHIKSVDELYDKKCAVMENGNVLAQIKMLNLEKNCIKYKNNRDAMIALENGETDCAIMRFTVGEALKKELGYNNLNGEISVGQSYMCFGIANKDQALADKINGAIEELKISGELSRLQEKWLTSFIHTPTFQELVLNNIWMFIAFAAVLICFLLVFIRYAEKSRQTEQEKNRYVEIVENLANDFECVNYVEFRVSSEDDEAILVRTSESLNRNIPKWESETNFSKRISLFYNTVVAPEDRDRFKELTSREIILDNLKKEGTYFVNFKAIIDGEPQYYQIKITAVTDEDNQIKAMVFGIHDIDEETKKEIADNEALKEHQKQLLEYQEKLEAANKSKTNFLFNMSHDIRTPMNAIIGFTELAQKHIDDKERTKDSLKKIESSGQHLLELINEVLDMSRVEAGKMHSEMKIVNVSEAAERLVTICQESATSGNIKLTYEAKNLTHPIVEADELHINQIVMNILGNAIKYTKPGGSVTYTIEEVPSEVVGYGKYIFTIEDTGIGMSKEFLEHIFESFSREENAMASQIQGTGLGMAIVKRLVDYMDGNINIESEQGVGTKVIVILHMRLAKEEDIQVKPEDNFEINLSGKKVLLVEDNELNREIATEILQDQGISVETAENGLEAVEQVKTHDKTYYDFILMDIQMPLMNGYEATKKIRELEGTDKIPIIALSANAFEEDKNKSLEAGMNDHVSKPIVIEELLGAMEKALVD